MSHRVTFVCDSCDKQYMTDESMELPPYWFAVQVAIADKDGLVPVQERDVFQHFCTQRCAIEYTKGNQLKQRSCMVDKQKNDNEDSGEEEYDNE